VAFRVIVVSGLACLALLAAGCGGGSKSPAVAKLGATPSNNAGSSSGGSSSGAFSLPPGAGVGASIATSLGTGAAGDRFTACMRSHGVPSFPDPDSGGGIPKSQVVEARNSNPQRFDAAGNVCGHLLPNGSSGPPETAQQQHTRLADGLSFARCMRGHGVTRFPDPTAQGDLSVEMVQAQGIDVHAPAVLRAVQACLPASHGALTPAKVRQALEDAGG
jgi:hypothetical protein